MPANLYTGSVIDAAQMRIERERLGLTQDQLGALVDEPGKNIGNWERSGHIPAKKQAKVEAALSHVGPSEPDRYTQMSDAALLAEMTRLLGIIGQRLADREQRPPMQPPTGETSISDVNTGEEQSSQEPGGGSTTSGQRRIRGRGPRRNLGQ